MTNKIETEILFSRLLVLNMNTQPGKEEMGHK